MKLMDAHLKSAGAYVSIAGLYPFVIGWNPHDGNIPVVRLGGHANEQETGWSCALREVQEEANIRIEPVETKKTYWFCAGSQEECLQEIQWDQDTGRDPKPFLVVTDHADRKPSLSLMYLARSDEFPTPSTEVKGILLLDHENVMNICHKPMTLGQYLGSGGKAVFREPFDPERILEPFLQLRLLSQLLRLNLL